MYSYPSFDSGATKLPRAPFFWPEFPERKIHSRAKFISVSNVLTKWSISRTYEYGRFWTEKCVIRALLKYKIVRKRNQKRSKIYAHSQTAKINTLHYSQAVLSALVLALISSLQPTTTALFSTSSPLLTPNLNAPKTLKDAAFPSGSE